MDNKSNAPNISTGPPFILALFRGLSWHYSCPHISDDGNAVQIEKYAMKFGCDYYSFVICDAKSSVCSMRKGRGTCARSTNAIKNLQYVAHFKYHLKNRQQKIKKKCHNNIKETTT